MKHSIWIPSVLSAAILVACGGGSTDTANDGTAGPSAPTGPITPAALGLSGVAATGAAIAGGAVEAKCASGTGSATSNADGSYMVSVVSGSLPCLLKITPVSGAPLYSVASGTGATATANINPVTQLVLASLTGADPGAYFAGFDNAAAASVTSAKVADAVGAVKTTLLAAGLDLGSIDVLAGALMPASGTVTGNAYDQALDALAAKLAGAGSTLADLAVAVAAASPVTVAAAAAPSTTGSATASLPAELLLKPAASNCAALRSASYRVIHPEAGKTLADQTGKLTIDAATLAVVFDDGSTGQWVPNGACRYLGDAGKTDIVVSPAGVIVARYLDTVTNTMKLAIGFPEQTHALAELEGTWNTTSLQYDDVVLAYVGNAATGTFSATGTLSDHRGCQDSATWSVVTTCHTQTSNFPTLRVNADGGFDVVAADATVGGRTFAYRAGSGDLMLVNVDTDGSFELRNRQRSNELPAVGRVSTSWDVITSNKLLTTPTISQSTNTVTAIDAATRSFTRLAKTVGGTDERSETVRINNPRNGYNFRAAATLTGTNGTPINVGE